MFLGNVMKNYYSSSSQVRLKFQEVVGDESEIVLYKQQKYHH